MRCPPLALEVQRDQIRHKETVRPHWRVDGGGVEQAARGRAWLEAVHTHTLYLPPAPRSESSRRGVV